MRQRDYFTTRTYPSGNTKIFYPPMFYSYHAEGDVTFASRGRNLGERNVPRKVKKWVRKQLFHEPRWKPWWTNHNTLTTQHPSGILRTRKRKT